MMTSFGGKFSARWDDDVIWREMFRYMGGGGGGKEPTLSSPKPCSTDNSITEPTTTKIWIHLPLLGKYGTKLTNSFIRKISPPLKYPCKFIVN